jgi:type VI secretion system protein ImpJ
MKRADKVVWSEGMFLTPHLLQQADLYHEHLLQAQVNALIPFPWGLTGLEIDREGLANGDFTLTRCNGILADGLTVQIPGGDEAPESRSVKGHFTAAVDRLDVHLAIPVHHPGAVNFRAAGEGGRPLRYQAKLVHVVDETTEGNEAEIPIARKNFRLLFSGEALEDTSWIKIAEVTRTPAGTFALDEDYVPPSATLAASPRLMAILNRLLELIAARGNALSQQRRHVAEFGASDIANFWLLHTIYSSLPILAHFSKAPDRHPEHLYLALVRLAGELCTFALQVDPRDLPAYDHLNLGETFGELEKRIVFLLETIIPTRYVIIPLEKVPEFLHVGRIEDERLLKSARFYLAANAQVPVPRLIDEIPAKSKIASPDQVGQIIGRAVRGVELTYEPVPPSAIPVKTGFKYFHLSTQGRWWETVLRSKALAIYLPDEFPDLKLELVALKE